MFAFLSVLERPAAMLAAVELAMFVDGVALHVERCLLSALRADDGAMFTFQINSSCHISYFFTIILFAFNGCEECIALSCFRR